MWYQMWLQSNVIEILLFLLNKAKFVKLPFCNQQKYHYRTTYGTTFLCTNVVPNMVYKSFFVNYY